MSSASLGPKNQQGWVYFAEVVGSGMSLIKIGWSANPAKRRKALLQQAPFDIRMVTGFQASPADERALHKRFAGCRGRGEWFNRDEALTDFINETLSRNGPTPWRRGGRPSKALQLPPVEHMEPPD